MQRRPVKLPAWRGASALCSGKTFWLSEGACFSKLLILDDILDMLPDFVQEEDHCISCSSMREDLIFISYRIAVNVYQKRDIT